MPTLNWCYGGKSVDLTERVEAALKAAHRYRNRLCELELAKRERHVELLRRLAPAYVKAESAVDGAEKALADHREKISVEKSRQRTTSPEGIAGLLKTVKVIQGELKALRAELKAAKQTAYADPQVKQAMDDNVAQYKEECRQAKEESGLYWGTEAIVNQSCRSFSSGAPPRFKRYSGEGQLAVQLQGGLDCQDIERLNTLVYFGESNGKRRECFFRIDSENGKPIFAKIWIVFHRPLPEGRIKWAYLERRKIADRVRWTLRLTIEVERDPEPIKPGVVVVHTGWRSDGDELRAATLLNDKGQLDYVRLSQKHCADYEKVDAVKSRRSKAFDDIMGKVRLWMANNEPLPQWLAEATETIQAWRSPARLAALVRLWRDNRFDGDVEIFAELEQWRKTDKHRWQHERRLQVRIVRRRKHLYRNTVAELARQYGVAVVSPIDAKELTENGKAEDLEGDNTTVHRRAKWAAVSDLVGMVREKFGTRCVEVPCENISKQCTECGSLESVGERKRQCLSCGHTEDVDTRAAKNILARGQASLKNGALLANEEQQRLKADAAREKLAKMQEANRAARKRAKELQENRD